MHNVYPFIKRAIDIAGAAVLLAFFTPLFVFVWIAIRMTSRGPGLFWSDRVGRNGQIFRMPKFRTMTICSKVMSRELASDDDVCVTSVGNFLRRTSIDELPQLWSVLRGHMSLIGPRPLLPGDQAAQARADYAEISDVRPGITGLAQINGRNLVKPRNKARYDALYAREYCLLLDAKIVIGTLRILHRNEYVK